MPTALSPNSNQRFGPSFVRWAGSKSRQLRRLSGMFPPYSGAYIEPFCGSSSLFFATRPASAFLSDTNEHLVRTYNILRVDPISLHARIAALPTGVDAYYSIRSDFNAATLDDITRSAYFIYLNRFCFNGLWRTNKSGEFNVPFGGHRAGVIPPLSHFLSCAKGLNSAVIRCLDFRETLSSHVKKGDFIYLDPPYYSSQQRVFVEYGATHFGESDLNDLATLLQYIDRTGAKFLLSYRDCDVLRAFCTNWSITSLRVIRNVGGFKAYRRSQTELCIANYDLPEAA